MQNGTKIKAEKRILLFNKNKKITDELNKKILEYSDATEILEKQASKIKENISSLKSQYDDRMDEMHDMEVSLQEKGTVAPDIDHSTGILKRGLSLLIEKDKSSKDNNETEQLHWEQSIDKLNELTEIRDNYSTALEDVKNPMRSVDKTAVECSEIIKEMSALSQNMSVAALNSAIEAGHLGDVGTRYVETAEKLRVLSEEYKNHADEADDKINSMMELFNRVGDSVLRLVEISKKEDAEIRKIDQFLKNNLEECKHYNGMEEMLSADSLKTEMDTLEELMAVDRENRNMLFDKLQFLFSDAEKSQEDWKDLWGGVDAINKTVKDMK